MFVLDDKKTLDDLCLNLNSKSPRLKIIDSTKSKKPRIIQNIRVKVPYSLPQNLIRSKKNEHEGLFKRKKKVIYLGYEIQ